MIRSERFLAHVRRRACCLCNAPGPSDPHHFAGSRGTALKADDLYTVPLCRACHDRWHQSRFPPTAMEQFWKASAMLLADFIRRGGGTNGLDVDHTD